MQACERPGCAERVVERVRRVRVIDDHGERLPGNDRLEATRDRSQGLDPASNGVEIDATLERRGCRRQAIGYVEGTDQRCR
jgi:hypothetical protein